MGMYQRRCTHCNKKRRYAEDRNTKPEKRWGYVEGVGLVCFVCVNNLTLKWLDK